MKVISFQDIVDLDIPPMTCYQWAETMIREKKKAILPPKISIKPKEGTFCNVMPSFVSIDGELEWGGVKIVTRYPNRVPSLESRILLMDAIRGEFLAVMDGTWITAMRTGAVAAHSIGLFAKKDFATVGAVGLGNVLRATLLMMAETFPNREMEFKLLRHKGQERQLAERFRDYPNFQFSFVDTPEDMVKDADVVLSGATYLEDDICEDRFFKKGVLVQPIHTRGFTNCDLFFDKIFADDRGHVCNFKNFKSFRKFAEVGEVVNGIVPGRENNEERILAYNIGISAHDIYFAASIYKMLKEQGRLESLPDMSIKEPNEKFWV